MRKKIYRQFLTVHTAQATTDRREYKILRGHFKIIVARDLLTIFWLLSSMANYMKHCYFIITISIFL